MGSTIGDIVSGIGGLFGAGTSAAQASQSGAQLANLEGSENNILNSLFGNYESLVPGTISSLLSGIGSGTGPLGSLFTLGNQVANGNIFPSAGTSALNTLKGQFGSGTPNIGAVIENTSDQIAQEGMAGQLQAKQAGAGIMESGLGSIAQLLGLTSSGLGSGLSAAGGLTNTLSQQNSAANQGVGTGLNSAIGAITSIPGLAKVGG